MAARAGHTDEPLKCGAARGYPRLRLRSLRNCRSQLQSPRTRSRQLFDRTGWAERQVARPAGRTGLGLRSWHFQRHARAHEDSYESEGRCRY